MRTELSFEAEIFEYLNTKKKAIQKNLKEQDVNATGKTSKSIYIVESEFEGELLASSSLESTESGTPAGVEPLFSALKEWVSARIDPDPSYLDMITSRIGRTIREEGSRLWQRGGRETIFTNEIKDKKAQTDMGIKISKKIAKFTANLFKSI